MKYVNDEKLKPVEDMTEAEKRKAVDVARAARNAVADGSIGVATRSPDEATGSSAPNPSQVEHPGKTEFDKALEAAQHQGGQEFHDLGKDI